MYDSKYTVIISSYQKLEFIGDSVLDYVITYYIYNQNCSLRPCQISNLRAAMVNNFFYASVVVKYGLHKYIRYQSIALREIIVKFVSKFNTKYFEQLKHLLFESIDEDDNLDGELSSDQIDEVDAPKVLSDVFEALIGAIYIDSCFSLNTVWQVVFRMIKLEIDHFMVNIPVMPVHRLTQEYVNKYSFSKMERDNKTMSGKIELSVTLDDGKIVKFEGFGKNTKQCRLSATKRFYAYLRKKSKSVLPSM